MKQQRHKKKKSKPKKSHPPLGSSITPLPPMMDIRTDSVSSQLIEAARFGNISRVREMLRQVCYSPIEFESISQAFLFAAEFGSTKICQLILHKLSPPLRRKLVDPALLLAAKNGHISVCKYMLEHGAYIETRGINGETPLLIAADNNHEKMCRYLLQRNDADLFCTDNDGNSLLHVACRRGFENIASMVLRYAHREGMSALQFSVNARKEAPIQVAKTEKLVRVVLAHCIETQSAFADPLTIDCPESNHPVTPSASSTKRKMESPFKPLPVDNPDLVPTSHLFWRTIGCGKDRCVFQSFAVYPFDRLQDPERIVVLTRVAEAMSGYKTDLKCNILNESTLYVIFAMMKRHIKEEILMTANTHSNSNSNSNTNASNSSITNTTNAQMENGTDCSTNCTTSCDRTSSGGSGSGSGSGSSDCTYNSSINPPPSTTNANPDTRDRHRDSSSLNTECCIKCVDTCNDLKAAQNRNDHSVAARSTIHPPSCSINDASPTPTPPPSSSASTSSSTIEVEIEATTYSGSAVNGTFTASSSVSTSSSSTNSNQSPYLWRTRTLTAFEQLFKIDAFRAGLQKNVEEMSVWSAVIDLIASTIFGESFWSKQKMFGCGDALSRRQCVSSRYVVPLSYWNSVLPDKCDLTAEQIQVMYRKLVTMSKSLLRKNPHQHIKSNENASLCFCPDCIADRQVPLRFKLQFLEEQAEEKQKKQHKKYTRNKTIPSKRHSIAYTSRIIRELEELELTKKSQITSFWSGLSLKEKRQLTSIHTLDLGEILSSSPQWETLRASLNAYSSQNWDRELLRITCKNEEEFQEQTVTLSDEAYDREEMKQFLSKLLSKILVRKKTVHGVHHSNSSSSSSSKNGNANCSVFVMDIDALSQYCINGEFDRIKLLDADDETVNALYGDNGDDDDAMGWVGDMSSLIEGHNALDGSIDIDINIRQDIWERYGRKMLEQVVLCEFAKKIALQYSKKRKYSKSEAAFKNIMKMEHLKKSKTTKPQSTKQSVDAEVNHKKGQNVVQKKAKKERKKKMKQKKAQKQEMKKVTAKENGSGEVNKAKDKITKSVKSTTTSTSEKGENVLKSAKSTKATKSGIAAVLAATLSVAGATAKGKGKTKSKKESKDIDIEDDEDEKADHKNPKVDQVTTLPPSKKMKVKKKEKSIKSMKSNKASKGSVISKSIGKSIKSAVTKESGTPSSEKRVHKKKSNNKEGKKERAKKKKEKKVKVKVKDKDKEREKEKEKEEKEHDRRESEEAKIKSIDLQSMMNDKFVTDRGDEIESKSLYASSACSYSNSKPSETISEDSKEHETYHHDLVIWSETEDHVEEYSISPTNSTVSKSDHDDRKLNLEELDTKSLVRLTGRHREREKESFAAKKRNSFSLPSPSNNKKSRNHHSLHHGMTVSATTSPVKTHATKPPITSTSRSAAFKSSTSSSSSSVIPKPSSSQEMSKPHHHHHHRMITDQKAKRPSRPPKTGLHRGGTPSHSMTPSISVTHPMTTPSKSPSKSTTPQKTNSRNSGNWSHRIQSTPNNQNNHKSVNEQQDDDYKGSDNHHQHNNSSSKTPHKMVKEEKKSKPQQDPFDALGNFKDGMMFICSNETYSECMEIKLLGLPKQYLRLVKELNPNQSALFLFNMTERNLHGVYQATDRGSENIDPTAWARNKHCARFSPFPAQIPFRVVYEFKPLPEGLFRHMFHDGNRIRKLDESETREILSLYRNQLKPKLQSRLKLYSEKKRTQPAATTLKSTKKASKQNVWTLRAKQKKKNASNTTNPVHVHNTTIIGKGTTSSSSSKVTPTKGMKLAPSSKGNTINTNSSHPKVLRSVQSDPSISIQNASPRMRIKTFTDSQPTRITPPRLRKVKKAPFQNVSNTSTPTNNHNGNNNKPKRLPTKPPIISILNSGNRVNRSHHSTPGHHPNPVHGHHSTYSPVQSSPLTQNMNERNLSDQMELPQKAPVRRRINFGLDVHSVNRSISYETSPLVVNHTNNNVSPDVIGSHAVLEPCTMAESEVITSSIPNIPSTLSNVPNASSSSSSSLDGRSPPALSCKIDETKTEFIGDGVVSMQSPINDNVNNVISMMETDQRTLDHVDSVKEKENRNITEIGNIANTVSLEESTTHLMDDSMYTNDEQHTQEIIRSFWSKEEPSNGVPGHNSSTTLDSNRNHMVNVMPNSATSINSSALWGTGVTLSWSPKESDIIPPTPPPPLANLLLTETRHNSNSTPSPDLNLNLSNLNPPGLSAPDRDRDDDHDANEIGNRSSAFNLDQSRSANNNNNNNDEMDGFDGIDDLTTIADRIMADDDPPPPPVHSPLWDRGQDGGLDLFDRLNLSTTPSHSQSHSLSPNRHHNPYANHHYPDPLSIHSEPFKFVPGTDLNPKAKEWSQLLQASPSISATSNPTAPSNPTDNTTITATTTTNTKSLHGSPFEMSEIPSPPSPLSMDPSQQYLMQRMGHQQQQQRMGYGNGSNNNGGNNNGSSSCYVSPQQSASYSQQQHQSYNQRRQQYHNNQQYPSQFQQYSQYQRNQQQQQPLKSNANGSTSGDSRNSYLQQQRQQQQMQYRMQMQQSSGGQQHFGNSNHRNTAANMYQMYCQQQQQQNGNKQSPNGYWNNMTMSKMKGNNGSHHWLLNQLRDFNGNNDCSGKSGREHTNNDKVASPWR